jgi:hypothetical protein
MAGIWLKNLSTSIMLQLLARQFPQWYFHLISAPDKNYDGFAGN